MGMFYDLYLFPVYFMMFLLLCWTQSIRQDCLGKKSDILSYKCWQKYRRYFDKIRSRNKTEGR